MHCVKCKSILHFFIKMYWTWWNYYYYLNAWICSLIIKHPSETFLISIFDISFIHFQSLSKFNLFLSLFQGWQKKQDFFSSFPATCQILDDSSFISSHIHEFRHTSSHILAYVENQEECGTYSAYKCLDVSCRLLPFTLRE